MLDRAVGAAREERAPHRGEREHGVADSQWTGSRTQMLGCMVDASHNRTFFREFLNYILILDNCNWQKWGCDIWGEIEQQQMIFWLLGGFFESNF